MVATPSAMVELGTPCPRFSLPDVVSGDTVSGDDLAGRPALLVCFICNHCPFVKHIIKGLCDLAAGYQSLGVEVIAICSNDAESHPEDSPEHMKAFARANNFTFPYLHDESQEVAKAFRAACTPDFFIYDVDGLLVYHGQMDDARPDNHMPVTGHDLREALDSTLEGIPFPPDQDPSIGCNIKWKPGNEPDYFNA